MHNLEIGSKGQVAFATRSEPAWHNLGTVFDADEVVTTAEMLRKAHLDKWDVRKAPIQVVGYPDAVQVGENQAVIRNNPFTPGQVDMLAIVGGRYRVFQNESLFAFGDNLLDGGGQWETAGSIRQGRSVFGSLLLPKDVIIDPEGANDVVKTYLLVNTSHDGTVGIQASTTPVRVVCQNTLNMALRGVKQTFKVRHTQKADGRVAEARKALSLSFAYVDAFEKEAQALYQTSMNAAEFVKIVTTVYPKPEDDKKGALTRWENKVDLLGDLFNGSVDGAPSTNANIIGTAWAGLNALTERIDWYRTARGGDVNSLFEAASGFSPVVNSEKNEIHSLVLDFAKAKNPKAFA